MTMAVALALGACGEARTMGGEPKAWRADVPASVLAMMDASFPADGEYHVQRQGRFELRSDTLFCRRTEAAGLDGVHLREALKKIGQSDYVNGSSRTTTRHDKSCATGDPVWIAGVTVPNREGQPYKIILAVWQTKAAWVGMVERSEGRERPGLKDNPPYIVGFKQRVEVGSRLDKQDLSKLFTDDLTGMLK